MTDAARENGGRRWLTPAAWAFGVALTLSLLVHMQLYGALWVLEILNPPAVHPPAPIEFELTVAGPAEPTATPSPTAPDPVAAPPSTERSPATTRTAVAPVRAPEQRRTTPPPPTPTTPPVDPEVEHRPPPPDVQHLQSITQHSDDPSVPPPPNARFLSRENRRVEEETVSRVRNAQRDDTETQVTAATAAAEDEGNAETEESADLRERQGAPDRHATEREAVAPRPRRVDTTPLPSAVASGDTTARGAPTVGTGGRERGVSASGAAGGASAAGGGTPAHTTVRDPFGTFVLVAPSEHALGEGPGEGGGPARVGVGEGLAGAERRAGASGGASGQRGRGRGTGATGVDLRVSWSAFEQTYTPEQLTEERERYVAERRSRAQGGSRERRWREFRSAIENYVPNVRAGNQTALNAAASPFADYLAAVHRRIHREFAERFLAGLPGGTNEFGDHSLMAKLEIILNRDGTVHRVGVVETSGFLPYDFGAFNAVMRAQPYPEAPPDILSGDGRVYFHWGFYRNERQCGTFNAEPYILPNPPSTPGRRHGPLQDRPELGGVIPSSAAPVLDPGSLPRERMPGEPASPSAPTPAPSAPAGEPGAPAPAPAAPPARPRGADPPGGVVG